MPAGGAVLDDKIGNLFAQLAEEFLDAFEMLAQSLAGRLGSIDTEADGVVVIDLEVSEAVVAQ